MLRRFRATIVEWKSNTYYIFLVCVGSPRCPAFNAHEPYSLINGIILERSY